MILTRRFAIAALVLVAPGGLLTHARLEAQIAAQGTVTVTFNVPVQLASLDPKFTQALVYCVISSPSTSTAPGTIVAEAKATQPLTNGAFNGTVGVQTTLASGSGQTWPYRCRFSLIDSATGKNWVDIPGPTGGALPPNAEGRLQALAKPGTSQVFERQGSFTVQ